MKKSQKDELNKIVSAEDIDVGGAAGNASDVPGKSIVMGKNADNCGNEIKTVVIGKYADNCGNEIKTVVMGKNADNCGNEIKTVVIGKYADNCGNETPIK